MNEYRIDFTITRRQSRRDDFTEIGFGSSGACSTVESAAHMVGSAVENREWETSPGMPEPGDA